MRIAIVDDIAGERELLRSRLEKQLLSHTIHADITEYENGEDFLAAAKKQPFTLVFLDIYMNGANGVEIAQKLRGFDTEALLVFTTTSTEHALDGFRVRALHYLVKPYTDTDFALLFEEIIGRLPAPDKYLEVKVVGGTVRLRLKDILYAEHFKHQISIYTTDGKTTVTRQSFGEFTGNLKADERFFVCNRNTIVNMEHAEDFDNGSFILHNSTCIPVSRDLIKTARAAFGDYLFKRGHK